MKLILASQSPRRRELLSHITSNFIATSADIDESVLPNEGAENYVCRLALQKAQTIFDALPEQEKRKSVVLGSDTSVIYQHQILGKPESLAHSREMLTMLSGNSHQVFTAFSLVSETEKVTKFVSTDVFFKSLTLSEIEDYWQTGEPQDKAGSYAIQGIAGKFVKSINGSVSNVVGLPLVELEQELKEFGVL